MCGHKVRTREELGCMNVNLSSSTCTLFKTQEVFSYSACEMGIIAWPAQLLGCCEGK